MIELDKPWIRMKNAECVLKKISTMAAQGAEKLQVITDFDMTLTRQHNEGTRCNTCHGMITTSHLMESMFRDGTKELTEKYYPIEIDPSIPEEEKVPLMVDWYTQTHNLLLQHGLTQTDLSEMVSHGDILLRDEASDLLELLDSKGVPLLIFSAGLGDIILEVIRQQGILHNNIKVVSNFMDFDDSGNLVGFKGDLIHMFKKNEGSLEESDPEYFLSLKSHTSAILLGDSLGDLKMAEGVPESATILKIGFLNVKIEERLDKFLDGFDIVLIDDQSMNVVNAIIKKIVT